MSLPLIFKTNNAIPTELLKIQSGFQNNKRGDIFSHKQCHKQLSGEVEVATKKNSNIEIATNKIITKKFLENFKLYK